MPAISSDRRKLFSLLLKEKGINVSSRQAIPRRSGEGPWPLSYAQQRLWFLDQLDPDTSTYNIPTAAVLRGPLDVAALARSLDEIVRRHESLRTIFTSADGQPAQVVLPALALPLPVTDLSGLGEDERRAEVRRRADEEARRPFDLASGPLLRAELLWLGGEEHVMLLTMHHIVSDGWSISVLIREIGALYTAYSKGEPSPLEGLPIQYADYAAWQREWLRGEVLEQQLSYWEGHLAGAQDVLQLPTDRPRPAVQSFAGATYNFALPAELSRALKSLAKQEDCTPFMLLLAAFNVLLHRYTGQTDICVGSANANRNRAEIEGLIGFFVNAQVTRTDLAGDPTFRQLLARTRKHLLEAHAHQDVPFEKLVDLLQPQRSLSHTPLFQVMFTLQNTPRAGMQLPGVTLSLLEVERATSKFDLTLTMAEGDERLSASFEYKTDLFDRSTVERMAEHFRVLLSGVAADPGRRVSELPLLTDDERRRMLSEWNDTRRHFDDARAHNLFERQAAATPDRPAALYEGGRLSFAELNARANRLAHYLRRHGVGPESRVAIMLGRSPEMVVALVGVLKAGGAYVPLDAGYPKERLGFMLEDAHAAVLLTHTALGGRAGDCAARVVCLDAEAAALAAESDENPEGVALDAENLAYVIYTSGSTGRPKGVAVTHGGLNNYLSWALSAYPVGEGRGAPVHTPLGFDLTITSLLLPLLAGRPVTLLPEERGVEGLAAALTSPGDFSLVKLTPAHLEALAHSLEPEAAAGATRMLVVGGEALTGEALAFWREHAPAVRVVNEYGPTETVVGCCVDEVLAGEVGAGAVPIGRPIANTRLYVLDGRAEPVPVGVGGELYIGGAQVARGYLNRPGLTAERFVPDPFSGEAGARLYRTGDLVRHLPGGRLEYVGRMDNQVKLRGFRVELGEIEAVVCRHAKVRECAAVVREDVPGDPRLVAYVVAEPQTARAELQQFLQERLPEYMLPSAYVFMEGLPLTPNGKVERRALPAPDRARPELEGGYAPPSNPLEEDLARMWGELLGVERVGADDDFFELGGHSLLAMQLISRVRADFGLEIPLPEVFRAPTVRRLAEMIEEAFLASSDAERIGEMLAHLEADGDAARDVLAVSDAEPR